MKNKRLLFITIEFYEYIYQIEKQIENLLNVEIDELFLDKECYGIHYLFNRISKGKYKEYKNTKNQREFFLQIENNKYDYIFMIVGRGLDIESFSKFILRQKEAKKVLYLWDDVKRVDNFFETRNYFDSIFSFDHTDCNNYNINFLPLFYCPVYKYDNEFKKIDFSFTGFLHSDREKILDSIIKEFPQNKFNWFAILQTTRKHQFVNCLKEKKRKKFYIKFKSIDMNKNAQILKQSKFVIDAPHTSQNGLSIRTFEALAANAKLITTNINIKRYSFYNPQNILIIDREKPVVNDNFISEKFKSYEKDFIDEYSLENWIRKLFDIKK